MAILCCLKTRWHKKSGLTKHILKSLFRRTFMNKIWRKWMMYPRSWCVCKQKLGPLLDYLSFLPRHKKLGTLPHQQRWSSMTPTPRVIVVVCSVKKHRRQKKTLLLFVNAKLNVCCCLAPLAKHLRLSTNKHNIAAVVASLGLNSTVVFVIFLWKYKSPSTREFSLFCIFVFILQMTFVQYIRIHFCRDSLPKMCCRVFLCN